MINKIIDGICMAINEEFGDDYEVYTETNRQGLNEPCFSIICVKPTQKNFLVKDIIKQISFVFTIFRTQMRRTMRFVI